jgi:hypothetical protein
MDTPKAPFLARSVELGKVEMQPARLEQLSEAPSALRPEPWAAFLGVQETPDARLRRFVGKTAKASRRRFIERIVLDEVGLMGGGGFVGDERQTGLHDGAI